MIRVVAAVPPADPGAGRPARSTLDVEGPATQRSVLDALEARYPMLRGTIRDHVTQRRRPFLRFFACEHDLSHEPPDAPLPEAVVEAGSRSSSSARSPADRPTPGLLGRGR